MTDQPYNRTILYPLEKPLADDLNQEFSQMDRSVRDTLYYLLRGQQGFLGTSFLVSPSSPVALSVVISAGIGWQDAPTDVPTGIGSVLGLNDLSRYKPIVLQNDLTVAVPTAPGANSRIDLIEVRYNRQTDNPQSRNFLDPNTNSFSPATVSKTLDFNVDGTLAYYAAAAVPTTALAYKSGVVAGVPVAPVTDTGYLPLAYITVGTLVTTIVAANIQVLRAVIGGGEYLGRQIFTAGGTYTPTTGTTRARIQLVGGGGGGGGSDGIINEQTASAGGASGVHIVKTINGGGIPLTGGPIVVGAAGAAGATGPQGPGGAGTLSSIVVNGVTWTATGGPGGFAATGTATTDVGFSGPDVAPGSSVGDYSSGSAATSGFATAGVGTGRTAPSSGGHNDLGGGGRGRTGANGDAGKGYGSGGGGTTTSGFQNVTGGAGAPGLVFVDEWT